MHTHGIEFKDGGSPPTAEEFKKVTEELGKAFAEFKKANEDALAKRDSLTEEKLNKINKTLDELSEKKAAMDKVAAEFTKRADEIEKRMNRPGAPGTEEGAKLELELKSFNAHRTGAFVQAGRPVPPAMDLEGYGHYKAAFKSLMARGDKQINADEQKALAAGVQPDGGYVIPADTTGRIVTRIFETSPIRSIASVQAISSDRLKGLKDTDQAATGGWVAETASRGETGTPQLGEWEIVPAEQYASPKATQTLLEDAAIDIEGWLANKVSDILTRTENAAFVNGTGAGQPRGIFTYPVSTTTDATRAWGTFEYIPTGADGDLTSADCLFNIVQEMKTGYLQNAQWLTRREVVAKVRKLKDSQNRYLWEPSLQKGTPQTLLEYPITIAQDVPAIADNSLSMAFGDFQQGYQIVDRLGITVLRDPYTAKPYVVFYTRKRTGGDVLQFECIKFLKFHST